ncbi:Retrovirus-related Pol polyprotein from transposon TNT 1-94 [Trichinella nelsoni]|uniref:Retrovirus-related Pol polyprotein from transposon TNT 1-94 n=1 Tax=Trichinella nelsoni TaxID=6336 RepID=A0A0V0RIL8_9BILA|nr:Retrovirus-related Pol polyprotein from transposon TNT 1-94 [Trichinella nelsoni]
MSTDSDLSKPVIAKVNSSNYQEWKLKMKVLLMRDGLWDLSRKECKAIAAICLTVEDDQLIHLSQLETDREMWQTQLQLHERASISSKLYLMRKLYAMRFTHGTMQSHINGILQIVTQLPGLGKNIEDEDLAAIMLCSLPDSYALVTALEGRDEADLTSSNEGALNTTASNAQSQFRASKATLTKSDNESRRCYYCGKKGHIKANCRKFKYQRKKDGKLRYGDVLYIPSLETGLLLAHRITNNGYKIMFQDDTCSISYQKEVVAEAKLHGSLFKLKQKHQIDTALNVHTYACLHKWHRRMGHRDTEAIRKLNKEQLANGMMTLTPFRKVANRAKKQIELIHSDICGLMPTATPSDDRYMMTLIDDYSRFPVVYLLKTKDEAVDRIKDYVATLHTKFGRNPVTLRTDNGRQYINQRLRNFLREKGIEHQFSAPYTPQQNGVAERKNRALVEMAKCMLTDAKLRERFWVKAVCPAAYQQIQSR